MLVEGQGKEEELARESENFRKKHAGSKLEKLTAGVYIVYAKQEPDKLCLVGRVWTVVKAQAEVVVHRHAPLTDGRLRVKWVPLFVKGAEDRDQPGEEGPSTENAKPSLENVQVKRVLTAVQMHDGVLGHAVARRLHRAGWRLDESQLRRPELGLKPGIMEIDNVSRFRHWLKEFAAVPSAVVRGLGTAQQRSVAVLAKEELQQLFELVPPGAVDFLKFSVELRNSLSGLDVQD